MPRTAITSEHEQSTTLYDQRIYELFQFVSAMRVSAMLKFGQKNCLLFQKSRNN